MKVRGIGFHEIFHILYLLPSPGTEPILERLRQWPEINNVLSERKLPKLPSPEPEVAERSDFPNGLLHLIASIQALGSKEDRVDKLLTLVKFKTQHILRSVRFELIPVQIVEEVFPFHSVGQIYALSPFLSNQTVRLGVFQN